VKEKDETLSFRENVERVREGLRKNDSAVRIVKNSSWLVFEKAFTMLIGAFASAIVARYFGPDNYGLYNYALSFVTLFTALSTMGLETITVKAIVSGEYDEGTVLCTSLAMRIVGGIILFIVSLLSIRVIEPDEPGIRILVAILSFAMVFRALEVIEYWAQAHQKAKVSSVIRMISYLLIALGKVGVVLMRGNLIHLALLHMLDAVIVGIGLTIGYWNSNDGASRWSLDWGCATSILSQSWHLVVSGLLVTLHTQVDKIMLGILMPSKQEVGVYSAAVNLATMWYFVPMAIITSFKPVVLRSKKTSEGSYLRSLKILYAIVAWLGIVFGVLILMFSGFVVDLVYGPEYNGASSVLSVSVWAGTFAMLGSARSLWAVAEGLQRYNTLFVGAGAVVNIALNYLLIPVIGGYGAALATLASQITVAIIAPFCFRPTRKSAVMMLQAFHLKGILRK